MKLSIFFLYLSAISFTVVGLNACVDPNSTANVFSVYVWLQAVVFLVVAFAYYPGRFIEVMPKSYMYYLCSATLSVVVFLSLIFLKTPEGVAFAIIFVTLSTVFFMKGRHENWKEEMKESDVPFSKRTKINENLPI